MKGFNFKRHHMNAKSYPELRALAEMIASMTATAINVAVSHTESEMPYKAQFVLEETIKLLQEIV